MDKILIEGGSRLYGEVRLCGAKNAVLPLLAGSLLTDEQTILHDCPHIDDVQTMLELLRHLGINATRNNSTICTEGKILATDIPCNLAGKMRSSVFLLGALLARCGEATLSLPGGCAIGLRPIDIHIGGLKKLGVSFEEQGNSLLCRTARLRGADIKLSFPSVGATENLIMCASLANGVTEIQNAAMEPEVRDLADFLCSCGARIRGAGSSTIVVEGVNSLHGVKYTPIPDRILAGTLICAVSACGGKLCLNNIKPMHILSLTSKLSKTACSIKGNCGSITFSCSEIGGCRDMVVTAPYPGFPTDLQAQYMAVACVSTGTTSIVENIFETRFRHVEELRKLGADISIDGTTAIVRGGNLHGAEVTAADLRGGAGLIIAGLAAEGETTVDDVYHVDRGYESVENLFSGLGAKIKRIK